MVLLAAWDPVCKSMLGSEGTRKTPRSYQAVRVDPSKVSMEAEN